MLTLSLTLTACSESGSAGDAHAPTSKSVSVAGCPQHKLADCPTCFPELLESMGFCNGHGVPEAICTKCRDDLEPMFRAENDWCAGHGLPESQCEACNPGVLDKWIREPASQTAAPSSTDTSVACAPHSVEDCPFCHPELMDSMGFCKGHGVPEAVCTKCRDDLEAAFRAEGDWCNGHGLPESHCEACNPGTLDKYQSSIETPNGRSEAPDFALIHEAVPRLRRSPSLTCTTDSSVVRLASTEVAQRIDIQVEKVQHAKLRKSVAGPATIEYDPRKHARLAPRASGIVTELLHDVGDRVEAGEVLVVLESSELGAAQSELLQAAAHAALWERNNEREQALLAKGLSTQKDALEAETKRVESGISIDAAKQRLANLGLSAQQVQSVVESGVASSRLEVTAPFAGTVIDLEAGLGELASPSHTIVSVVDTARMWVFIDVEQSDARLVELGHPVLLTAPGWEGETLGGTVKQVSSAVDPVTRTVKVRAEFDNQLGMLRAHSFTSAKIITRDEQDAVLVPASAVQWEGCCNVVFQQRSATEYAPRKVRLGHRSGDHHEVLEGLDGGESVVTQGSFILKTELRKGSIGAGCCEVDHLSE